MATKRSKNELLQLVTYTKTRINAGAKIGEVARELGLSRYKLEESLMHAGYRYGFGLWPIQQIDVPMEAGQ